MQSVIERYFAAFAFILGAGAAVIVLNFPWFSFLSTIVIWTGLRAPRDFGFGHMLNIRAAATISDAAFEGLCLATAIVFGVTLLFEGVTASLWS